MTGFILEVLGEHPQPKAEWLGLGSHDTGPTFTPGKAVPPCSTLLQYPPQGPHFLSVPKGRALHTLLMNEGMKEHRMEGTGAP